MKAEPEGVLRLSKDYYDLVLSGGQEAREMAGMEPSSGMLGYHPSVASRGAG